MPQDPRVVAAVPTSEIDRSFYVLIDDDLAIFAVRSLHRNPMTRAEKWLAAQIELPKSGIGWFVRVLEEKFFRSAQDGGLEHGKIHCDGVVDGEHPFVIRGAAVGGEGQPGYTLMTRSRLDPEVGHPYSLSMTDELLFERGLLETLKRIAAQIDSGKL
jgi:hypothetical protein